MEENRLKVNLKGAISMTDLELKKSVESELNWEPSVNAAEIGVAAKNGIVTLTGHVQSYWQKIAAERAAVNALDWSITVPADRIKVKVSKGWITLEGTVEWQYQKAAAEKAVRDLMGVKGV